MPTDENTVVAPVEETSETTEQTQETVETVAEQSSDPLDAITDPEELRKAAKAQRAIAQRYKRTPPAKPLSTPASKVSDEVMSDIRSLKLAEAKRQFGYKHSLSPEETDKLFKYAGNDKPEDALKDPFFQSALESYRREKSVKEAIPSSSNRAISVEGKSFKDMTSEERAKNWAKVTQGRK